MPPPSPQRPPAPEIPPPEAIYPSSDPIAPQRLAARCLPGLLSGTPPYLVADEQWQFPALQPDGKPALVPDRQQCVYQRVNFLLGRHGEEWYAATGQPMPSLGRTVVRQIARLTLPALCRALPATELRAYAAAWRAYLATLEEVPIAERKLIARRENLPCLTWGRPKPGDRPGPGHGPGPGPGAPALRGRRSRA